MVEENKTKEWSKELEKVGLTEEVLQSIVAASPAKEVVLGYPQDQIQALSIQENW